MVDNSNFFEECTDASRVKQFILEKYFLAWASIIVRYLKYNKQPCRVGYIDLFSGPGRYEDGTESTPIMITKKILENPLLYNNVILYFNDKNAHYVSQLQSNIDQLPGIEQLHYKPIFENYNVDHEIVEMFNKLTLPPSLVFIDPCGYEGFSMDLVFSVSKDFGCDCIAFLNYNRINMHISNNAIPREKLNNVLSCDTEALKSEISRMTPVNRERRIITHIKELARNINMFSLTFKFKSRVNRTSHFLLFFTKHFTGYDVMKDVMYRASSIDDYGVADFQFEYGMTGDQLEIVFDSLSSLSELRTALLSDYVGKTIGFDELYKKHSVDKRYVMRNYKTVLRKMLADGEIHTNRKPKSGFPEDLIITFPEG